MISINWQLMFIQIITFAIGAFIVWKLGWKPILAMIEQRNNKISSDLIYSEDARVDAERMKNDLQKQLEDLNIQSKNIIAEARHDAQLVKDEIMKSAHIEAEEFIQKTKTQMLIEQEKVMSEIRPYIISVAMEINKKILHSNAHAMQPKIFEDTLALLKQNPLGQSSHETH